MGLLSFDALTQKRTVVKKRRSDVFFKQLEGKLKLELLGKLDTYLVDNDRVMIEVDKEVIGEFQNILSDALSTLYLYDQVDETKYIFRNREVHF